MARDKLFTKEAGDRSDIPNVFVTDGKHRGTYKGFDFKAFVDNINKTFKVGGIFFFIRSLI